VSVSRNITSSKTKGVGAWSDAEIKRAITQGIDRDGNHLKPPMGFSYYANMTEADRRRHRLAAHRAAEGVTPHIRCSRGGPHPAALLNPAWKPYISAH
jgi:hypothetical protein